MQEYTKKDTIFIQIASYRDPELQWTLKDLFEKAKRPENIFIGICHQYDMKGNEDKHLFEIPFSHPKQLRIDNVDYRDSKGICWAKDRARNLYNNEKWFLFLDSHHRFIENWDEILVLEIKKIQQKTNNNNIILSQCPPTYNIETNEKNNYISNRISCKYFIGTYTNCSSDKYSDNENLTLFCYGCFVFSSSTNLLYRLNPKSDNLDEVPFSISNWTNRFDLYVISKPVIWHYWPNGEESEKNIERKKYKVTNTYANNFMLALIESKKSKDNNILEDIKQYHLGNKRTLRDYERFSGINFRKKTMRERTKQGIFEEWKEVKDIKSIKKLFKKQKND